MSMLAKKGISKRSARWRYAVKHTTSQKCRRSAERFISTYTGSPDSVDVANLLNEFQYCPSKQEEILKKYQKI